MPVIFFFTNNVCFPWQVNKKLEEVAREREQNDLHDSLEEERRNEEMRRAEEEERRRREEQRRASAEARQKREREERERREREEEERLRREKLEAEERAKEEIERKAREERERLARDAEEQERQRKKQALLAKLSAIDDEKKGGPNNDNPNILGSPSRTRKDWKFTDPVENMHSGKPAYDLVTSSPKRKNKLDNDDDEFSYKPSFGASSKLTGPKTSNRGKSLFNGDSPKRDGKKKDLMASLFGGDDVRKPTPPNKRENSGLNFSNMNSNSASKNKGRQQQEREHSSTQLFGGGSAIVDDEAPPSTNNRLLPRRTSHQSTTFTTHPAVNQIDDFEDIEEVVL